MMKPLPRPNAVTLIKSATACIENGNRLLDEMYDLEFRPIVATRYYLAMIAQEEFAKAFMLFLVRDNVIPFTPEILRAMKDHVCKQLLGIIMDYIIMYWEEIEELEAMVVSDGGSNGPFPPSVASALNLLRHEKIGRWENKNWCWAEDPAYDPQAVAVAEGKKDQRKQDALYIRIGRDGRSLSNPAAVTKADCLLEKDRASRYGDLVASAVEGAEQNYRFEKAIGTLKILFQNTNVVAEAVDR
jgi:AbiV